MSTVLVTHYLAQFQLVECKQNDFRGRLSNVSIIGHIEYETLLCAKGFTPSEQSAKDIPLGSF